jgi:TolA-binding protein
MKSPITAFALVLISLFTTPTSAQDIASQDGSPMGKDMDKQLSEMQKDMNSMLQQIAKLRQQSQLQKNVNMMQRQIEGLESTTDPKERQNLLQAHMQTLQEHIKMVQSMSEAEVGSGGKKKAAQVAPVSPGRVIYGPGPTGYPGGMMYGPGMMGGPQGYPGGMIGPGRPVASPPGGMATPRYR